MMRKIRYKMFGGFAAGFSLIEVIVAMVILTMIVGSVMVVMGRISDTVINWQAKAEAFEICRENMENILAQSSVKDMLEFGESEINPEITWEKKIESFYEPITNRMWIRAMCTANYFDTDGAEQKIELEHWVSSLSKKQIMQIADQKKRQAEYEEMMEELDPEAELEEEIDEEADEELDEDEPEPEGEDPLADLLGTPPPPYKRWDDPDMPSDVFWANVMRLFK